MKRAAVYRLLYGEDFIRQSVESVIDAVDAVYVFWTNQVWGGASSVMYQGKEIVFPQPFDDAVAVLRKMASDKIRLIEHYHPSPHDQFTELINNHTEADVVVIMEADQVIDDAETAFMEFEASKFKVAACQQIEYWKTPEYQIPQRNRPGPIFWRPPLPNTRPNGLPNIPPKWLGATAKNYGFCVTEKAMYWKHLTAISFSGTIGDSQPNPDWYDKVWLVWTPETINLEISIGHESAISHAYRSG